MNEEEAKKIVKGLEIYYDNDLLDEEEIEENELVNNAIETVLNLLEKKDKQIDLMAEYISKIDIEEDICIKNKTNPDWCNEDYTNCKDCIKQYFERKVKKCTEDG